MIAYIDKIIKAWNVDDFSEKIGEACDPHPSTQRFCELMSDEEYKEQYEALLKTLQRHKCYPAPKGCLRNKGGKKVFHCLTSNNSGISSTSTVLSI